MGNGGSKTNHNSSTSCGEESSDSDAVAQGSRKFKPKPTSGRTPRVQPEWGPHGTEGEAKFGSLVADEDSFVPDGPRQKLPHIEAAPELLMPLLPYQKV